METTIYTRQDYLDGKCSHAEYYGQFVDAGVIARVSRAIGVDRIKSSTDPHFNDIPLRKWDRVLVPVPRHIARSMKERGDYATLAGAVCVAKAAARQIRGK